MRKHFSSEFKAKVALEAFKGEKTIAQLSSEYGVHATQIGQWKELVQVGLPGLFTGKRTHDKQEQGKLIEELYQAIGQLKVENDWLKKKLRV
jgi:transposase-like protein